MKYFILFLLLTISQITYSQVIIESELGHINGRADAKYGTYFSVVPNNMKSFQKVILELENNVRGFIVENPKFESINIETVKQAGDLYLLENYCLSLMLKLDQLKIKTSDLNKQSLNLQLNRIYKEIRILSEKNYETMIRFIDLKFPGPNGIQNKKFDKKSGKFVYEPNYRTDKKLTTTEKEKLYRKKIGEFVQLGGKLKDIEVLDKELFNSFSEITRLEYIQFPDGRIIITQKNPGHILLASGSNVLTAGQMVIVKSKTNKVLNFVISNASGSYKPDIFNIELLVDQLSRFFDIPHYIFTTTKGEPLGLQTAKILLKGLEIDPVESKKILADYENKAASILDFTQKVEFNSRNRHGSLCSDLFD